MRKYWKEKNRYIAEKEKSADAGIKRMMLTSVLGMLICVVCLAGTTWAWFTAQSGINDNLSVEAAEVKVEVKIAGEYNGVATGKDPLTIKLTADQTYSVTIEATSVTATKGYCYVEVDGKTYVADIKTNNAINFNVCSTTGKMEIKTTWKTINGDSLSGTIGTGGASTQEYENKGDSNYKDAVITNKDDTDDGNTEKDNVSDKNGGDTPAPGDTSEQGSGSGTHAAE